MKAITIRPKIRIAESLTEKYQSLDFQLMKLNKIV